jgi:hypothetical protein
MSGGRLIPAYTSRAGWAVVAAYLDFLESDELDGLRDAVTELIAALARDPASVALDAPEPIVEEYLAGGR